MEERSLRTTPVVRAGAVLLGLGALALGGWQLQRDQERNEGRRVALAVSGSPPLGPADPVEAGAAWRRVDWEGRYFGAPELVAQRIEREERGYGLLQRFERADGLTVWVDRGWVGADGAAETVARFAAEAGPARLTGQLRPLVGNPGVEPAIGHGGTRIWPPKAWPSVVATTPTSLPLHVVAGALDGSRQPGAAALDGFEPVPPRDDTSLHYAAQWFGIAVVAGMLLLPSSFFRARSFSGAGH